MAWDKTLQTFKDQFQTLGPEKYGEIENPELRYDLANQRSSSIKQGASIATGMIARNANEAEKAATSKKEQGYKREYNNSGGFSFFGPDGKPISAFDYAIAKQVPITQVLEGSYDPSDINFLEDMSAMMVDMNTKDPQTGKPLMDYQQGLSRVMQDYPTIFMGQGSVTRKYMEESKGKRLQTFGPEKVENLPSSKTQFFGGQKKLEGQQFNNALYDILDAAENKTQARNAAVALAKKYGVDITKDIKDYKKDEKKTQIYTTIANAINGVFPDVDLKGSNYPF